MAQMTVIGLFMIPLFDILIKIESLVEALLIPFVCCKKEGKSLSIRVGESLRRHLSIVTNMNEFEIQCFKQ